MTSDEELPPNDGSTFYFVPEIVHMPDGRWQASYPGHDWTVSGDSRQAATEALIAEDRRRLAEQEGYLLSKLRIGARHLKKPLSGVYRIPPEVHEEAAASGYQQEVYDRYVAEVDAQAGGSRG